MKTIESSNVRQNVRTAVFAAIDEVNEQRLSEERLESSEATVLFGEEGVLDSLGLVNFIVATEQHVEELLGVPLTLADERAMAQETNPFETVGSLIDYAAALAEEEISDR